MTPEMLPMIVTVCLSKGALAMSRQKVIVKRLNAIQNFGAMHVLCIGKTGTLTMDRVIPADDVDPEQIAKPRPWSMREIYRFIVVIGPCSSIFDYTTFFMMLYLFNCWDNAALFQTIGYGE